MSRGLFSVDAAAVFSYFIKAKLYQPLEETLEAESNYGPTVASGALNTFSTLSASTNGEVDRKSFISHMEQVWKASDGDVPLDFSALFDAYDSDGNGTINLIEFLNGLVLLSDGSVNEKANVIFDAWDSNRDGFLTREEITEAYSKLLKGAWTVLDNQLAANLGMHRWNFKGLYFSLAQALLSTIVKEDGIENQVNKLMAQLDDSHDGSISRQEWLAHCAELPLFKYLDVNEEDQSGVSIASRCHCTIGEGPHWEPRIGTLYFIDILEKKKTAVKTIQSYPGCLSPSSEDPEELLVATQEGLAWFNISKLTYEIFVERMKIENKPQNRFNDGKCDPAGRLWVGSMEFSCQGQEGSLYCFESDGNHRIQRTNISISNGLCWSPDAKTMYFIDSLTRKVVAFDYDKATGDISNERDLIIFDFGDDRLVPDGMTIDSEGFLWIAIWGGARVEKRDPKSGECITTVPIPALNVTSCCWGGEALDVLYVTTAAQNTDLRKYPAAGCLFSVKNIGARGSPMNTFPKK